MGGKPLKLHRYRPHPSNNWKFGPTVFHEAEFSAIYLCPATLVTADLIN